MGNLIISLMAQLDIDEIGTYISKTLASPKAANRTVSAIVNRANLLATFPHSGTLLELPESPDVEYRRVAAQRYVIIYHVKDDTVYIDRVVHESSSYFDTPLG